jgi:putative hydrolase of the HAD superfamily
VSVAAVIFDWGGTLTEPLEPLIGRDDVWRNAARNILPEREGELVEELIAAEERLWEISRTEHRSSSLVDLFAHAAQALEVEIEETVIEEATRSQLDLYLPHIAHDPDATKVVSALRDSGLRIGLLSNTLWPGSFHDQLLERDGLAELIDVRLYTSELHHTKPHPKVFEEILRLLGVDDPSEAVFVGDRPWDDIYGAKRAGLRTVLRPSPTVPDYDVEPDAVIHDLPSLLEVVAGWR